MWRYVYIYIGWVACGAKYFVGGKRIPQAGNGINNFAWYIRNVGPRPPAVHNRQKKLPDRPTYRAGVPLFRFPIPLTLRRSPFFAYYYYYYCYFDFDFFIPWNETTRRRIEYTRNNKNNIVQVCCIFTFRVCIADSTAVLMMRRAECS